MATVSLTPEAQAQVDSLPSKVFVRVMRIIERLEDWPNVSGAKPLRHGLAGRYRIRTGDYRVQFFPDGSEVIVEKVGHRDGFYDE